MFLGKKKAMEKKSLVLESTKDAAVFVFWIDLSCFFSWIFGGFFVFLVGFL